MGETVRSRLEADGLSLAWQAALAGAWTLTVMVLTAYVVGEFLIRTTDATARQVETGLHPHLHNAILLAGVMWVGVAVVVLIVDWGRQQAAEERGQVHAESIAAMVGLALVVGYAVWDAMMAAHADLARTNEVVHLCNGFGGCGGLSTTDYAVFGAVMVVSVALVILGSAMQREEAVQHE